ncbi:MAG: hypothetical protein ACLVJ6_14040 [Merdibacter sp.]
MKPGWTVCRSGPYHRFREFRPAYQSVIDADPRQAQWLSGKGKFKDSLTDYLELVRQLKQRAWPLEVGLVWRSLPPKASCSAGYLP